MDRNFSSIHSTFLKKAGTLAAFFVAVVFLFLCFEFYIPADPFSHATVTDTVQKGDNAYSIGDNLQKLGLIRSSRMFQLYVLVSFQWESLQAGQYAFSPKMSMYQMAKAMSDGDVIKNQITIVEGWDENDIAVYLSQKGICTKADFSRIISSNYSSQFDFLKDKPKSADLEGYLFPDTYEIAKGESCQDVVDLMLKNFGKKLTPDLRNAIAGQHKSIFEVMTMASILEKEVRTVNDKKIVSGILWKRISIGMPLQVDSTVNYITGKNTPGVSLQDTKINSPYNTYKYYGLPPGPISNPGIDSIMAAIYPIHTSYLYYLTGFDDETIFSDTLQEQQAAEKKYLGK